LVIASLFRGGRALNEKGKAKRLEAAIEIKVSKVQIGTNGFKGVEPILEEVNTLG